MTAGVGILRRVRLPLLAANQRENRHWWKQNYCLKTLFLFPENAKWKLGILKIDVSLVLV